MESLWARDWTCVPCTGRYILNHWTPGKFRWHFLWGQKYWHFFFPFFSPIYLDWLCQASFLSLSINLANIMHPTPVILWGLAPLKPPILASSSEQFLLQGAIPEHKKARNNHNPALQAFVPGSSLKHQHSCLNQDQTLSASWPGGYPYPPMYPKQLGQRINLSCQCICQQLQPSHTKRLHTVHTRDTKKYLVFVTRGKCATEPCKIPSI